MKTRQDAIDFLKNLAGTDAGLPSFVDELKDDDIEALSLLMQKTLEHQMKGVDAMMDSMTQSMKYIPNVFLQMMAKKYVTPELSARLTRKMTMKQVVGLTKGMPVDYITEVAAHQEDTKLSAEIMENMKAKDIEPVVEMMCQNYPAKALDIAEFLGRERSKMVSKYLSRSSIDDAYMTPQREQILGRLGL